MTTTKHHVPGLRGWIDLCSDTNWQDYHGMWGRKAADGSWYVLRFTNMIDACGERDAEEMGYIYECQVLRVDLGEVPAEELADAIKSCGLDLSEIPEENREAAKIEALVSYGVYAPLESFTSKVRPANVRARARRTAEKYMRRGPR